MTLVFSRRLLASTMAVAVLLLMVFLHAAGQSAAKDVEWRSCGADLANTHYSPLDQINGSNFSKLEVAWRFKTASVGSRPETNLQSTPLMVGGVVYSTAGTERAVVALDAVSGQLLWSHTENEGARAANAPRQLSGRGLAYWSNGPGNSDERILYVTPGYRLIALNAKTGVPVPSFGRNGVVDLKLDDDQEIDLETGEIGLHATPVVAGDTVIVGTIDRIRRVFQDLDVGVAVGILCGRVVRQAQNPQSNIFRCRVSLAAAGFAGACRDWPMNSTPYAQLY